MKPWSSVYDEEFVSDDEEEILEEDEQVLLGSEEDDVVDDTGGDVVVLEADDRDIQLVDGPPPENLMEEDELQDEVVPERIISMGNSGGGANEKIETADVVQERTSLNLEGKVGASAEEVVEDIAAVAQDNSDNTVEGKVEKNRSSAIHTGSVAVESVGEVSVTTTEDDDEDEIKIIEVEEKVAEETELVTVDDDEEEYLEVDDFGAAIDTNQLSIEVMEDEEDDEGGEVISESGQGADEDDYEDVTGEIAFGEESEEEQEEFQFKVPFINELRKEYNPKEVDMDAMPTQPRQTMNDKHPKFKDLNNMQIVSKMVDKGKIVNPADDEDDKMYFNKREEGTLAGNGIKVLKHFRKPEDRNGNEVLVAGGTRTKALYLGGGIPLEPVLANPQLNSEVEKFRKELGKHRRTWSTVTYLHPKRRGGWKVDPSSIVPASISGSTGSSSIGSETDPECLATDDESENELISGSIAAWIVPDQRGNSRSPSPAEPEFEVEEPEFILTSSTGSHHNHHHVNEPPTKKRKQKHDPQPHIDGKIYPKPGFSYSCLIAMSLKNSKTGCLPVSEIYKFMCDHFPYFKTAPSGWKNSVRHNLSLNKCFEKIEKPGNGARKGCLWALNPAKIHKMDEEVQKWSRKDPLAIRRAMSDPENLEAIERGEMKKDYSGNGSDEDEEEEYSEPGTPLTPAQLQARRSRTSSADSAFGDSMASPALTTVSQVHAAMHRPQDQKIHIKKEDPLEFGTITNVQGNYICTTPGAQTYTLSFSNLGSTTPIIIRRTPVK